MKKILIIATGGTIDAEPYEVTPEDITPLKETMIPKALEILGLSNQCKVKEHCMEDSKNLTNDDLENIATLIAHNADKYEGFIITHGTDTAPENGRFLQDMIQKYGAEKPVALVCSMQPLLNGKQPQSAADVNQPDPDMSGGWLTLKYAVQNVTQKEAGVYVGQDATLMPVDGLRKNFEEQCFYYPGHTARLHDKETTPQSGLKR